MRLRDTLVIISIISTSACMGRDYDYSVVGVHDKKAITKDSEIKQVFSLDMSGPRPVVMLSINGKSPQPAIFDTGAMNTVVNIDNAEDLELHNEGPLMPPFDKAHAREGYQTTLKNASIDGIELPNVSVPVMPLPLPGYVAVISPNVFGGRLVSFNFLKAQLEVSKKNKLTIPKASSYQYSALPFSLPTVPVVVGPNTFNAHLDTGSPVSIIFPMKYSQQLQLDGGMEKIGIARTHMAEHPIYKARIAGAVKVGTIVLENPEVRFTDAVPHVNVGMELLRQMQIILDPEEKRLWVKKQE